MKSKNSIDEPTHPGILLIIKGKAKQDVLAKGQVLAPGVLRHIADTATSLHRALDWLHVAQDGLDQGGFASTHTPSNSHQLARVGSELWDVQGEALLAMVLELGIALKKAAGTKQHQQSITSNPQRLPTLTLLTADTT
jgi:hypothetical protein